MTQSRPCCALSIGFVLFALAITALVWCRSLAETPGPRSDVPPDVIERATIARQHMNRIRNALAVYMNQYDWPPAHASALYPEWIDDPLAFWHPGDSDPPPTTIDNDVPNAPNSALISFDIDLSGGRNWPDNHAYIRDNSAANNGGLFINENWGMWYTDPPGMMPWPTATAVARYNLRGLVSAIRVYSNDNSDWWPTDLMQLVPDDVSPSEYTRRFFWHPGDNQPMPTAITNSILNALDSAQISFEYLVAGLNENSYDPNLAFFRDNSPINNGGLGTLTVYADGRVEYQPLCWGDATADLHVNFDDFVRLADNLGAFGTSLPLQGDLNADSNADMRDVALLQLHFGESCAHALPFAGPPAGR